MRTLKELLDVESSWPVVQELIGKAVNKVNCLPVKKEDAEESLLALDQSVASLMGAITYKTGGILVDDGWLRILGGTCEKLSRNIANWNLTRSHETGEEPGFLMVADDILGGIFAINGNFFGPDAGMMYYLAPDTLEWEGLEVNFHDFLSFVFTGDLEGFYSGLRWEGWHEDIAGGSADDAFAFDPPLWDTEAGDISARKRAKIPMDEMFDLLLEMNNLMISEEDDDGSCGCGEEDCGCTEEDRNSDN